MRERRGARAVSALPLVHHESRTLTRGPQRSRAPRRRWTGPMHHRDRRRAGGNDPMRAVLQRSTQARVLVDDVEVGRLDPAPGIVALVGVGPRDGEAEARLLADKIAGLRIFMDEQGKINRSVRDIGGGALGISQFTPFAGAHRGPPPRLTAAPPPAPAAPLGERAKGGRRALGISLQRARAGAPTAA